MTFDRQVTRLVYEWDYESTDEHGDILDHMFFDDCPGLPDDDNIELVLVRNELKGYPDDFENSCDLDHRAWAYVKDGKLPEEFDDGYRIPQRFHKELAKAVNEQIIEQFNKELP